MGKGQLGSDPIREGRTGSVLWEDRSVRGRRWIQERPDRGGGSGARPWDRVPEGLTQSPRGVWTPGRVGELGKCRWVDRPRVGKDRTLQQVCRRLSRCPAFQRSGSGLGNCMVSMGVQTVLAGGERHNSKPTHAFSSVEGGDSVFCFPPNILFLFLDNCFSV